MPRILVFGNPLVEEDALPLKLLSRLQKAFPEIEFVEFDPAENLESEGPELLIIDTVHGIAGVSVFDNVDSFQKTKPFSLHDFDLGMTLRLMKKMGTLSKIKIFGVPACYNEKKAFEELKKLLKASLF